MNRQQLIRLSVITATACLADVPSAVTAQQFLVPVPFTSCDPSSPKILALEIHAESETTQDVTLGISIKNVSQKTITVERRDPQRLFAARVLDSVGKPVELTPAGKDLYAPAKPDEVLAESAIGPVQLKPEESLDLAWRISDIFDLSKPGTYSIALKEEIDNPSPKGTLCSNTIRIDVKPPA